MARTRKVARRSTGGKMMPKERKVRKPRMWIPPNCNAHSDSSSSTSSSDGEGDRSAYEWYVDLMDLVDNSATPSPSAVLDTLARGGNFARNKLGKRFWDDGASSPLHTAVENGHVEAVRLLVEVGAALVDCEKVEWSYRGDKGDTRYTPLYQAVRESVVNAEMVRMLLDLGADPERPCLNDGSVETPLDLARRGDDDIIQTLQEHKESLEERNKDKATLKDVVAKVKTLNAALNRAIEVDGEIEAEEERIQADEERIRVHKKRIADLKKDKGYLTSFQKKRKIEEIDEIGVLTRTLLASTARNDDDNDDDERGKSCPICFKIPPKAFSCVECSNFLCEECLQKTAVCPTCRVDFSKKPPQRNIAVERLLLCSNSK